MTVVLSVVGFDFGEHAGHTFFVDFTVAVVVCAVTNFDGVFAAFAAAVFGAFVYLIVTVVIDVVAGLSGPRVHGAVGVVAVNDRVVSVVVEIVVDGATGTALAAKAVFAIEVIAAHEVCPALAHAKAFGGIVWVLAAR